MNRRAWKPHATRSRFFALAAIALLGASTLAAAGLSEHLNEILDALDIPRESVPETNVTPFENAKDALFNEYDTLRQEPQVPANYFYDSAGEDLRIGGFGEWMTVRRLVNNVVVDDSDRNNWEETVRHAKVGEYGFSFGNEDNEQYKAETVHSYLFSPMLDLRSTSVEAPVAGNTEVRTTAVQEQITLRLWQKYHFASGNDGARIEVFDRPPDIGRFIAMPIAILQPDVTSVGASSMQQATAFASDGNRMAYTGRQADWEQVQYDLSAFAGQRIYLAFHVGTNVPPAFARTHFQQTSYFDQINRLPFYGWKLDGIQVEGPAFHTNLRLRQLVQPFMVSPDGEILSPSGPGPIRGDNSVFEFEVENRGSVTESGYTVAISVERAPGQGLTCENGGRVSGDILRPGGNTRIRILCDELESEELYHLTASVTTSRSVPDADSRDNSLVADIRARTVNRFGIVEPVSVDPQTGDSAELRTLKYRAVNTGNDDAAVQLTVEVLDPSGLPAIIALDRPQRNLVVPMGEAVDEEWVFLLPGEGLYTIFLRAVANGEELLNQRLGASTLTSPEDVFFDNQHNMRTGAYTGDWSTEARWPPTPVTDDAYWHLNADDPSQQVLGGFEWNMVKLVGSPSSDPAAANQQFSEIRVTVRHQIISMCGGEFTGMRNYNGAYPDPVHGTRAKALDLCRVVYPIGGTSVNDERHEGAASARYDHGLGSFFVNAVVRLPVNGITIAGTTTDWDVQGTACPPAPGGSEDDCMPNPYDTQLVTLPLQLVRTVGPERDRMRFYSAQWVEEEFLLRPSDIDTNLETIPGLVAQALRIEVGAFIPWCYHNRGAFTTPLPTPHAGCPRWWIDEVRVQGTAPGAEDSRVIMRTTGLEQTEVGEWTSETYLSKARSAGQESLDTTAPDYQAVGLVATGCERARVGADFGYGSNPSIIQSQTPSPTPGQSGSPTPVLSPTVRWSPGPSPSPTAVPTVEPSVGSVDQIEHGCPFLVRRVDPPTATAQWNLHNEPFLRGGPAWWLGPSEIPTIFEYHYPSNRMDLLYTPTLQVPPGLDNPTLMFHHKFRFRGLSNFAETSRDYGAVFVQFMSDGVDPQPTSPLYQLAANPVQPMRAPPPGDPARAAALYQSQAFVGNSCQWYRPTEACGPDIEDWEFDVERISLEPLQFLNYSAINAQTMMLPLVTDVAADVHLVDGWRTDVAAFENGTRSLKETGARVRFAFGFLSQVYPADPASPRDGWFIGPIQVLSQERPAHDVRLNDLQLEVPYDAQNLGFGPGTQITFVANLTNAGIFSQTGIDFVSTFTNVDTGVAHSTVIPTEDGFSIAPDAQTQIDLHLEAPDIPGLYNVFVELRIRGRTDQITSDNCLDFDLPNLVAIANAGCDPRNGPAATVQRFVDMRIDATVNPRTGRTDDPARGIFFPRTTFVTVTNLGNVDVSQFFIERQVQRIKASGQTDAAVLREWRIPDTIRAGESATLANLNRILVNGLKTESDLTLSFADAARYLVTFQVDQAEDRVANNDATVSFVDVWDVFYSTNFETDGEDRSLASFGEWQPGGTHPDTWNLTQQSSYIDPFGRGRTSYFFGDPGTERYPDRSSSWLQMPAMDLANASLAFLSFRTNYTFETGFDGGLVEASTDHGQTWRTLVPDPLPPNLPNGYSGSVISSNALNPTRDPTVTVNAFTGESRGITSDSDWIPVEVNLAQQIPEFRRELIVEALSPQGFGPNFQFLDSPTNGLRTDDSWRVEGNDCPRCWEVHAPRNGAPALRGADGNLLFPQDTQFWWSGVGGARALTLNLTHPDARFPNPITGFEARLSWWQYAVGGGITPNNAPFETRGQWQHVVRDITLGYQPSATGPDITPVFNFPWTYTSNLNTFQHGFAITNITLQKIEVREGGVRIVADEKHLDFEGGGAFAPVTSAPGLPVMFLKADGSTANMPADAPLVATIIIDSNQNAVFSKSEDAFVEFQDATGAPTASKPPAKVQADADGTASPAAPTVTLASGITPLKARAKSGAATEVPAKFSFLFVDADGDDAPDTGTPTVWFQKGGVSAELGETPDAIQVDPDGSGFWLPQTPWTRRTSLPSTPLAWRIVEDVSPLQSLESVWAFRNENPNPANGFFQYPANSDERLVTPVIDLSVVVGNNVVLSWQERGRLQNFEPRRIEVQVLNRFTAPPSWGPWQPVATLGAFNTANWVESPGISLTPFLGQQIRVGFRVATSTNILAASPANPHNGWFIDDVRVRGETMVGGPLLIRFHAGTDATVSRAGWGIDNVQVVGRAYTSSPGNIAILLDPPPPGSSTDPLVYRTAPGTTLDITGTISNLSPRTWVNLGMRASVRLPTGSVAIPPILPANMINPNDPNTLGPFLVPPALGGDVQNDRIPFTMRLTVPPTVLVGQTEVPLDGTFPIQFTLGQFRSGVLTPIRDENLGDHLARRTLRVQNVTSLAVDTPIVSNLNPAIGEDVVFELRVINTGTQPSSTTLIPQIRRVPEAGQTAEAPILLAPVDVALEAGQTSPYQTWTWTPTGPGIYAFEVQNNAAYLATPPPPTFSRYLFVDRDLLYFSSDLEELSDDIPFLQDVQDPNVWSREFRNTGRSCTNAVITSEGSSGWQSNERAFSGSRSVLTAVTDEQYGGSSQNYGPLANDILYQPAADLRSLTDPGRSGSPSVLDGVYLNVWYRAVTGAGDGITFFARSVDQETLGFPTTRALTPLDTTNWRGRNTACGNPAFTMNLPGSTQRVTATGYFGEPLPLPDGEQPSGDLWRPASFNLAQQSGLVGQWTQPLYVFGSDGDADRRQGVFVDLISVSGYDPRVDPPVQSFGLTDNATKEFQLRIENRAPVADRFTIGVDENATSANFIVDPVPGAIVDPTTVGFVHVEPSTLDLRAGETGTVTVRVDTRLDRELGSTGRLFIGLAVNSTGDPNRIALGRIEFPTFSPRIWPDLEAEIRVPATSTKAEGEPLNMLATISNFGLAVNPRSTYRILACPAETVQPLADCINDPARVIGSGDLPSIQPLQTTGRLDLSRLAVPLSWSPPLGSAGELRLVVVADPAGQVTDYDRSNNIHVFTLTLTPHIEPDLSIVTEDLHVLNAAGDPVTSVLEGDLVSVRATVRNIGSAPAPSVRVRLINQFTLREDQIPSLDPGSSVEVAANWVAVPGTWVVKAEATTSRPETDLDNNVVAKKIVVRRNDFSLDATIPDLTGKPGDKWDVPLTLTNKGDVATKVAFRFKAPQGIRAEVTPSPLQLPIGAELDATLRISADDQMKPGVYAMIVEAFTSDGTRPPATLAVSISLQGQAGLRAPASLATTAATGNHTMAIPLVNTGTVVALYQWAVVGPDGWRFSTAESSLRVLPGQTGQLRLDIDVPDDYAPGQYTVTVTLSGAGQTQVVPIHIVVAPRSVFETTVLRETIQPHAREILVRLENVGNIVGVPTFTLLADADGLRASIDPPLEALDPGQVSIHKVLLTNPSGATDASVVQVGSMILPSKAGPSSPSAKEAKADLELQSLEATPDRSVRPGTPIKLDASVANKGNVELPAVPVALYVDGVLADQKMVLIPVGAVEQVTFAWRASAGLHLLMVVVDPFDELPETDRANNLDSEVIESSGSRGFAAAFIPDLSIWAAVGAVALVALRARRRNNA